MKFFYMKVFFIIIFLRMTHSELLFLKISFFSSKFNTKKEKFTSVKEKISSKTFQNFKKMNLNKSIFFLEHLVLKNKYTNLISKNTQFDLFRKHFLDTITLVIFFQCFHLKIKKMNCLDLGTGSGFPGLLLSIIFSEPFFLLIESVKKKNSFHKSIIDYLILNNSKAISCRIESIGKLKNYRQNFNFLTARAVSEIKPLVQFSSPFIEKKGKIIIFKQIKKISEEIKDSRFFVTESKKKIKGVFFVSSLKKGRALLVIDEEP